MIQTKITNEKIIGYISKTTNEVQIMVFIKDNIIESSPFA